MSIAPDTILVDRYQIREQLSHQEVSDFLNLKLQIIYPTPKAPRTED